MMGKKPFIAMMILGAGAILVLALQSRDSSIGHDRAESDTANRGITGTVAEETAGEASSAAMLEQIMASNARIVAQLERMDTRLTDLESDKAEEEDLLAERERQREMLKKAKSDPKLIARYNEVQQASREKRRSKIGERFEAEPIDHAWAEEAESTLTTTFDERVGDRAILEDVTCRSSMCKMVLDLPSAANGRIDSMELAELEIDLLSGLASGSNGPIQAHHWLEDDGLGGLRYVTFAARPGRSLPPADDPFRGMDIEEAIDFLEKEP